MTCAAERHDTLNAYWNLHCRCPQASALAARRQKEYRAGHRRLVIGVGTARRIRALYAIGWRGRDLAELLGVDRREVAQLGRGRGYVLGRTATRVATLYDALWNQRGPSSITAARAARNGWLPPLWWDDERIDDPAYDPRTDVLVHPEDELAPARRERAVRLREVARLTAASKSARQIADELGISARQVVRDRGDIHERTTA